MGSFLVESFTPRSAAVGEIEARARNAAHGTSVHYVRSIFMRGDEICFHLVDAPSAAEVSAVIRAAGIAAQRIIEVDEA
jgi:FlaG/FlaF family flagellin (archaellin)